MGLSDRVGHLSGRLGADELRTRLWPAPLLALVAAVVLGIALPRADAAIDDEIPALLRGYLFGGGADAARSVLSTIVTSLITVTSLTFSLTVITLQLASSQYSPRLLRTFTRDRFVHRTLAVFVGSFVYALTVLRTVRSGSGRAEFVPQISVTVAFGLCLASVVTLVFFLAHLAQEIRVETILRNVHDDATGTFQRVLGARLEDGDAQAAAPSVPAPDRGVGGVTLLAPSSGFIVDTSLERVCRVAAEEGAVVVLRAGVGDSVVEGTPVGQAWSPDGAPLSAEVGSQLQSRVSEALVIRFERMGRQDIGLGLRQITDVGVRALSPGLNDPTTAVHALGHAAALLCDVLRRNLGPVVLRDQADEVRVVIQRPGFEELLDLAISQPRAYGAADRAVLRGILDLLLAVAWVATRPEHRRAIDEQLTRTERVVAAAGLELPERAELDGLAASASRALHRRVAGSGTSG